MRTHTVATSWRGKNAEAALTSRFEEELKDMLKPLLGMRMRASLFAIEIGSLGPPQTLSLVRYGLAHIGLTGALRGGGGMLYLGPRLKGANSDCRLERMVADILGWNVYHLTGSWAPVEIVAVHLWLDQISSGREMIDELSRKVETVMSPSPRPPLSVVDEPLGQLPHGFTLPSRQPLDEPFKAAS